MKNASLAKPAMAVVSYEGRLRRIPSAVQACMKWEPTQNERRLECAIVQMALSAQEVELSPDDLTTMRRLTKTLRCYLRLTDSASARRNCAADQKPPIVGERPQLPEMEATALRWLKRLFGVPIWQELHRPTGACFVDVHPSRQTQIRSASRCDNAQRHAIQPSVAWAEESVAIQAHLD